MTTPECDNLYGSAPPLAIQVTLSRPGEGDCTEILDHGRYAALACAAPRSPHGEEAARRALSAAREALREPFTHDHVGRRIHALSAELLALRDAAIRPRPTPIPPWQTALAAVRLVWDGRWRASCLSCGDAALLLLDEQRDLLLHVVPPHTPVGGRRPLPDGYSESTWHQLEVPPGAHLLLAGTSLVHRHPSPRALLDALESGPDGSPCVWLTVPPRST